VASRSICDNQVDAFLVDKGSFCRVPDTVAKEISDVLLSPTLRPYVVYPQHTSDFPSSGDSDWSFH